MRHWDSLFQYNVQIMRICCGDDGTPSGWLKHCPGLHASACTSQLVLFLYRFCIESDKDQIRRAYPRESQPQSVYSANRYPVEFPAFVSACDSQKQPKLARKL